jgi:hypothetical protein
MASKTKHQKKAAASGDGLVTRLCSINSNGLIFIASSRLEVSSEVTLAVQTSAPGVSHEWEVHGWVVDCRVAHCRDGLGFRVTLLFHDLPAGLKGILADDQALGRGSFLRLRQAPLFGMN